MRKAKQTKLSVDIYFRLGEQSREVFGWILPIIKANKLDTPRDGDETAYFALAYEILRVVQSNAFDRNMHPTRSKSDYLRDKKRWIAANKVEYDTAYDNNRLITRFLLDDDIFASLAHVLQQIDVSDEAIAQLREARRRMVKASRVTRWEIASHNIDDPTLSPWRVPVEMILKTPATFRHAFFLFRWSTIIEFGFDASAEDSYRWYNRIIADLEKSAGSSSSDSDVFRIYLRELLPRDEKKDRSDDEAPEPGKEHDATQTQRSRRSDINRLWGLQFLHADYAGLIQWNNDDSEAAPFLSDFIANRLGPFLLFAENQKGWFWYDGDKKRDFLLKTPGRTETFPETLSNGETIPRKQPVHIGNKHYAYRYLRKINRKMVDDFEGDLELVDPAKLFSQR